MRISGVCTELCQILLKRWDKEQLLVFCKWSSRSLPLSAFSAFQWFWSSYGPSLRSLKIWWEKVYPQPLTISRLTGAPKTFIHDFFLFKIHHSVASLQAFLPWTLIGALYGPYALLLSTSLSELQFSVISTVDGADPCHQIITLNPTLQYL